jgi:hypothetical protein
MSGDDDFTILVRVSYALYQNEEHPAIATIAKRLRVKHDGGGMLLIDANQVYEHVYYGDGTNAFAFAREVDELGIAGVELIRTNYLEDFLEGQRER